MADSYKVRLESPSAGEVGILATMIAPLLDLDADVLEEMLQQGPAEVGDDLSADDAHQLVNVFRGLGAKAEIVGGPAKRSLLDSVLSPEGGVPMRQTVPFDARQLRTALMNAGPGIEKAMPIPLARTGTQPFSAKALREALGDRAIPRRTPVSGAAPISRSAKHSVEQKTDQARPGIALGAQRTLLGMGFGEQIKPPPVSLEGLDPLAPIGLNIAGAHTASFAFDPNGAEPPIQQNSEPEAPPKVTRRSSFGSVPVASIRSPRVASKPPPQAQPVAKERPMRPTTPPVNRTVQPSGKPLDRPSLSKLIHEGPTGARHPGVDHSALTAALLSTVLPGMGQVYNGQRTRAVWFALGSLLVLPWLWGIFDAWSVAGAIHARRTPAPNLRRRKAATPGQLVLDLAIFVAIAGVLLMLQESKTPEPTPVSAPVSRAVPPAAPVSVASPVQVPPDVSALMEQGRTACAEGKYAVCEALMHKVIATEPKNKEAYGLLVDATSQQKKKTP